MTKRLLAVAFFAAAVAVAGLASNPASVAADPGEDEADAMRVVSSDGEVQASGQVNPWGCYFHRDKPHESKIDPGPGHAQAKARIECRVPPPVHVATIWQELSKWEGSTFTIEAVKTSVCPSGIGEPDCHPTLRHGVLMQAYINAPCEIGTRKRYVQLAYATLTVDGVTYRSRLDGQRGDVDCTGRRQKGSRSQWPRPTHESTTF